MEQHSTVIDYLIDQAETYDASNMSAEDRIIKSMLSMYDSMGDRVMDALNAHSVISTTLQYQTVCNILDSIVRSFHTEIYNAMSTAVMDHTNKGYSDMDDLVEMSKELMAKFEGNVNEMKSMPDPKSVEFMRQHAFEQVTKMSNDLLGDAKSKLGQMMVSGKYTKKELTDNIEKILMVNRSRAKLIAQTEMSMAYNYGALERMREFNSIDATGGRQMMKYWYGFKSSGATCNYCRPRIGSIYPVEDNTEMLPAHPNCRCSWIPYMEGWNSPISTMFTRKADMIKRSMQPDVIYDRINKRLGISYASGMGVDNASRYLSGEKSEAMNQALRDARDSAVRGEVDSFNIAKEDVEKKMGDEFNYQMKFWQDYVAKAAVDNDTQALKNSHEAIKGLMLLPWDGKQLRKWDEILQYIENKL